MNTETIYRTFLTDYPDILEVGDVCKILGGLNKNTVYKLIKEGQIESLKVGKKLLTPKINVLKYLGILQ